MPRKGPDTRIRSERWVLPRGWTPKRAPKPRGKQSYVPRKRLIIGIDGEGFDLPDGRHIYTLLSAVDENGKVVGEVENQEGLSSKECFDMLLALPRDTLKFIFMGSYDWTKIIEDLNPDDIYRIMHPETRRSRFCLACRKRFLGFRKKCPHCDSTRIRSILELHRVDKNKFNQPINYGLDWFNGSFTVAERKVVPGTGSTPSKFHKETRKVKWGHRNKVWDCFKFFQCSFVKAIENWKIGTKEQWERIAGMKAKRGEFHNETPEDVRTYCQEECHLLAQMMRAVIEACGDAGIKLTRFDGAGSIASAMLKENQIKDFMGPKLEELPDDLHLAVMSAYFGGRFENSVVGSIRQAVYARDINSAYPYAIMYLPCLSCGKWERVTKNVIKRARKATLAVVKFKVKEKTRKERQDIAWMPLPCRDNDDHICFPTGFSGWAWWQELKPALEGWMGQIQVSEAWVYNTECVHKPFRNWIPQAYRNRYNWGKDGKGIVMKLGLNACAGKTMQNAGDSPPFKSFIWGGVITATTRGQALEAIASVKNRWNILAVATDGVFMTEDAALPETKADETKDLEKPLGGWDRKVHESGAFFVKPGMYFDESNALMRARGVGRSELKSTSLRLVEAFKKWDRRSELKVRVTSRRFYGARTSVLGYSNCSQCNLGWPGHVTKLCPSCGKLGDDFRTGFMHLPDKKTDAYGRWAKREIDIEFDCFPKRESVSLGNSFGRLRIRDMGGFESRPYLGETTPEGLAARQAQEEALEEPDWSDVDD